MPNRSDPAAFPIVALGGSAGSLAAFTAFLETVEASGEPPGMAVIVIPHLSPDDESHMGELLQNVVSLPVSVVETPMAVEVDHVYVLAPGHTIEVADGQLRPRSRKAGAAHHPVDDVFASLAADAGARAVAVVLSGTGSNGSSGLSEIRAQDGLALAQTPETAEFGEMPRRAADTGLVDAVLPPEEMFAAIARYRDHLRDGSPAEPQETADGAEAPQATASTGGRPITRILADLRRHAGLDFRHYKIGTLQRRIDRRAHLCDDGDWAAYADRLRDDEAERDTLIADLLITVTSFFRDEPAWEELRETTLSSMIEEHAGEDPLRVWVAGCATGEEAYSAAILLMEEARARNRELQIEVFATDASAAALARARAGVYPAAAVQHLSAERQSRYFEREDDKVRVRQSVRENVVFAPQNLIQDPPFSRIDLVICRNVLIYLQPAMQQKLVRLFHFALKESGRLFLGTAETVGDAGHLFESISKKWRIYRRQGSTRHDIVDFPLVENRDARPQAAAGGGAAPAGERTADLAVRALAERHAPPSVLIDGEFQALYYHGEAERFLKPQSGEPSQDILALARDGMAPRLRRLVAQAKEDGTPQSQEARLTVGDASILCRVQVAPVKSRDDTRRFLVSFVETPKAGAEAGAPAAQPGTGEKELQEEIDLLRDEMAKSGESASRTQEELKSYNEEIMSMNEELRAANEELETSKEELQSLNEELNTVNTELRSKVEELNERTSDLDNLLVSTDAAILFLDSNLCIRWFSPDLEDLFGVRSSDVGRSIADLVRKFDDDGFNDACRTVLRKLTPDEKEVPAGPERWYHRRILPYRAAEDRIDGVVVTFADITNIQHSRQFAERIVETVPTPLLVLDPDLRVISANPVFYRTFDTEPSETKNRLIYDLGNGQWNIPELRRLLSEVLPRDQSFEAHEVRHEFEDIGEKVMLLNGRRIEPARYILLAIEDITERRQGEAHQDMLMHELNHRVKNALGVVQGLASQTLARSETLDGFKRAFEGRLAALSRGHAQLLDHDWSSADIQKIVRDSTATIAPERVRTDGPRLLLPPKKAMALNLCLHELETNAVKYGALSDEQGRIAVTWHRNGDGQVELTWQKADGPPVEAPTRQGFGSRLLAQLAEFELEGDAEVEFAPDGLRCALQFPIADPS